MRTDYRLQTTDNRLEAKSTTSREPRATIRNSGFIFFLTWCVVLGAWSAGAYGASYDIKEMTPQVREALAGRQQRYAQLQAAKRSGAIHENEQGLVSGGGAIANDENNDRMVIYRAIAEQNNLGPNGLDLVKRAFAETIRERDGR